MKEGSATAGDPINLLTFKLRKEVNDGALHWNEIVEGQADDVG